MLSLSSITSIFTPISSHCPRPLLYLVMNFDRGNSCAPSNFQNFHTFAFNPQHSRFTFDPPPGQLRHGSDWDPDAQKRQQYNLFYSPILIPRLEPSTPNSYNHFQFSHVDLPPLFIGMDEFEDLQTNCQNILFLDNSFEAVSESGDNQDTASHPINRFQLVSIGPITQEVANNFIAFASLQLTPTIQYPSQSLHSTTHPPDKPLHLINGPPKTHKTVIAC